MLSEKYKPPPIKYSCGENKSKQVSRSNYKFTENTGGQRNNTYQTDTMRVPSAKLREEENL